MKIVPMGEITAVTDFPQLLLHGKQVILYFFLKLYGEKDSHVQTSGIDYRKTLIHNYSIYIIPTAVILPDRSDISFLITGMDMWYSYYIILA